MMAKEGESGRAAKVLVRGNEQLGNQELESVTGFISFPEPHFTTILIIIFDSSLLGFISPHFP